MMVETQAGRSFKSAVMGTREGGLLLKEPGILKVPINEALCKELQGSVVGFLAREKDVRRIQTTIYMEGFQSVFVTHVGGNMAMLRSSVVGDVERLLRSKKDTMKYYFSEIKPWNPGLFAVQRELGVLLDFDAETISMARFDVARLKILTDTWKFFDEEFRVEVEGVCFNLWVVEEKGRQRSVAEIGGEYEEQGSAMLPSVAMDGVGEGVGGDGDGGFSGEDEESGNDMDVDRTRNSRDQAPKQKEKVLTCEKSNYISISQMEIPPAPIVYVGNEVAKFRTAVDVTFLAESAHGEEREVGCNSGTQGVAEAVQVDLVDGGPQNKLQLLGQQPEPAGVGHNELGSTNSDPNDLGLQGEIMGSRYTSLSEPEEAFSSHRALAPRRTQKLNKNRSGPKFNPLGAPTCIKLREAVKEVGAKARRGRRLKEGRGGEVSGDGSIDVISGKEKSMRMV
ncbi:hypothetical protein TSUD_33660 [Trifolium subterraneum]|uniref:DUF4283 domain-containing protein n=1 Tax=Trifolium subterraneum TaxID=3900 RepID=A0A2Z6MSC1_TRISU|nr:hypothetical protein TSUD_33660 [Trifolium subterraneum]